jgi:hypothetical protein
VLRVARDLALLSESDWLRLESQRDLAGKLLWRLYESVRRRAEAQGGR